MEDIAEIKTPAHVGDDRVSQITHELNAALAALDKYRKAAEKLARQAAEAKVAAQGERAALIKDHDEFIVKLTQDHDRIIAKLAEERDEAREEMVEAVSLRDGVAQAAKKVARQRTEARRELSEILLERDIARRDLARTAKQLEGAKAEIERLQHELHSVLALRRPLSEPPLVPMPEGIPRSSHPPPKDE